MPYKNPDNSRNQNRIAMRRWRKNLRAEAFQAYGRKCACPPCGETDPRFLTFDHINNDGAEIRRLKSSARSRASNDAWLSKQRVSGWPPTVRVLCWNCNCGRAINGGICPHLDVGG